MEDPITQRCTDVLFVGHVPPPWTGQGVIHHLLLQHEYSHVRLHHLPMLFSKASAQQGKLSVGKFASLVGLIATTYRARFGQGIRYLYFSPGGPRLSAIVRDALYLLATRPVMRGTMLVYHSSGVAAYLAALPAWVRPILRRAFTGVELVVQLSPNAPADGAALGARQVIYIANAVSDEAGSWFRRQPNQAIHLLYMGVVTAGKGVKDLLEACRILASRQVAFELRLVGAFTSEREEGLLRRIAADLPQGSVHFDGPLSGSAKREAFVWADVFCFPSYWPAETFPLVLLEAFSFGLPIVATRWRGIPDLMGAPGECGTLVDIHAIDALADAVQEAAHSPELRVAQSRNARQRYESCYTPDSLYSRYDDAFTMLVST